MSLGGSFILDGTDTGVGHISYDNANGNANANFHHTL